jgi:outer membrane receptor protein involved in Fe transport
MKLFSATVFSAAIFLLLPLCLRADGNQLDTLKTYRISEVLVTSSAKETNNLRKLPASVTLVSPQAITERRISELKDLSSLVPNLYIPDYGAKLTSAIYIRGIGARSSGQSVGLYVDNVPYLDKSIFDFELTDISRIEVLRGPQGTLYGRNAMGGIVNIYTLSPFNYQGTRLSLSGGNYGQFKAKAATYQKLSPTVGLSVSAYYDRNDGYFTNIHTGKKADAEESVGGRLKFDWHALPQLNIAYTFSTDYGTQGGFPYGLYHRETGKADPVNIGDSSAYKRFILTNSLFLEYTAPRFILTSTTGHQYFNDDMRMDQDFSPKDIFTLQQKQTQNALSEEIVIRGANPSNYHWSFGLYGFYDDMNIDAPVIFKEDGVQEILQNVFNNLKANNPAMPYLYVLDKQLYIPGLFHTPSWGAALFHQSTYNNLFTPGLSVTAGLRLDYERQKMAYNSTADIHMGMSFIGPDNIIELPVGTSSVQDTISQSSWQLLPKLSLKYECTPRTYTYISVAKGYKAGGYNVQMSADVMQTQMQYDMMSKYVPHLAPNYKPEPLDKVTSYQPEHSWNYELGIRSELVVNTLNAELTFFYTDIREMQLTKFVDSGNGRILANAGHARSIGLEASAFWKITDNLSADVNYGLTDARFIDYIFEKKIDGEIMRTDCKDNRVPYIPNHTLNVGLQYSKLLRGQWIDQFTASAQASGFGSIEWTELNDISQPFYVRTDAKFGVRKGRLRLDIWCRNLTNTQYSAFYFESFGNSFVQKGKPFRFGADVSYNF